MQNVFIKSGAQSTQRSAFITDKVDNTDKIKFRNDDERAADQTHDTFEKLSDFHAVFTEYTGPLKIYYSRITI